MTLDLDGDAKPDRTWIVATDGGAAKDGTYELHIRLGSSGPDAAREGGELVLGGIASWVEPSLESPRPGSLELRTCTGCGANRSTDEVITIVYRKGRVVVGGFRRDWEWLSPLPSDEYNMIVGGCDINFLTGVGTVSSDLGDGTEVAERFKPISLSDWSPEKWPKICRFEGEE